MKAIKIASVTALAAAISAQSMATNFVSGADLTVSGSLNTAVNFDILNGGGSTSSTGSVGLKVTDGNFNAGLTLMGIRDFATACDKGTTVQDKPGLDLATNMVTVANNKDNFLGCETDEKYGPSGVQDFTVNAGNWSFGEIGALPLAKLFPWEGGFVQGDSGIAGQSTGFGGYGVDYPIRYDSAGLLYATNIG